MGKNYEVIQNTNLGSDPSSIEVNDKTPIYFNGNRKRPLNLIALEAFSLPRQTLI